MGELAKWVRYKRDGFCLYGLRKKDGCMGALDVHHITSRGAGGRNVPENLITLCRKHHIAAQEHRIKPEELRQVLDFYFKYRRKNDS